MLAGTAHQFKRDVEFLDPWDFLAVASVLYDPVNTLIALIN
jgi:hypothetical protein